LTLSGIGIVNIKISARGDPSGSSITKMVKDFIDYVNISEKNSEIE